MSWGSSKTRTMTLPSATSRPIIPRRQRSRQRRRRSHSPCQCKGQYTSGSRERASSLVIPQRRSINFSSGWRYLIRPEIREARSNNLNVQCTKFEHPLLAINNQWKFFYVDALLERILTKDSSPLILRLTKAPQLYQSDAKFI